MHTFLHSLSSPPYCCIKRGFPPCSESYYPPLLPPFLPTPLFPCDRSKKLPICAICTTRPRRLLALATLLRQIPADLKWGRRPFSAHYADGDVSISGEVARSELRPPRLQGIGRLALFRFHMRGDGFIFARLIPHRSRPAGFATRMLCAVLVFAALPIAPISRRAPASRFVVVIATLSLLGVFPFVAKFNFRYFPSGVLPG